VFNSIASILQKLPDYLNVAMVAAKAFLAVSAGRAVANFIAGMALGGPASAIGGVIAGGLLYNYLLGLGSGIQTSPPSIGGGESGVSMTPPLNPITATAQQNTQAAAPANQVAPVFTFHHVTQLDGQVLTKYNAKETMKTQGLGNNKR
jgi:hypothetical protein